ncbi:hypothetical protein JWH16_00715, partial [Xanthomonas campestris pv. campestris]
DKPDDLLGAESALLHVRPLGFTDFIASAGTAQWGQVTTVRSYLTITVTLKATSCRLHGSNIILSFSQSTMASIAGSALTLGGL